MPPLTRFPVTIALSRLPFGLAAALLMLSNAAAQTAPRLSAEGLEGGNLATWQVQEDGVIRFTVRPDTGTTGEWRWYYFRVENSMGREVVLELPNASRSSASQAWGFNQPFVSSDEGATWQRLTDTQYRDGAFRFRFVPRSNSDRVALAPPYEYARALGLVTTAAGNSRVAQADVLARSVQGRAVHRLVVRHPEAPADLPVLWVLARQHPGETGGSWKMEGLLEWLLSGDADADALLRRIEFHLVPCMNPDGVVLGNYRRNSLGLNLNREWSNTDPATAPTVHAVREAMTAQRDAGRVLVAFVDLHSISVARKNFMYTTEDMWLDEEYDAEVDAFLRAFEGINPKFNHAGTEPSPANTANVAKNWAYLEFTVPSYTFETAYQDIQLGEHAGHYMQVEDYRALGRDMGRAIKKVYLDEGWFEKRLKKTPAVPAVVGEE